jgi:hypothetical protein
LTEYMRATEPDPDIDPESLPQDGGENMKAIADGRTLIEPLAGVTIVALTFAFVASPLILLAVLTWRATS